MSKPSRKPVQQKKPEPIKIKRPFTLKGVPRAVLNALNAQRNSR